MFDYESKGRGFESLRARQVNPLKLLRFQGVFVLRINLDPPGYGFYTDSKPLSIVASVLLPLCYVAAREGDERRQRRGERIGSPMSKEESKCCKACGFRLFGGPL